jgi:hypothetical protein
MLHVLHLLHRHGLLLRGLVRIARPIRILLSLRLVVSMLVIVGVVAITRPRTALVTHFLLKSIRHCWTLKLVNLSGYTCRSSSRVYIAALSARRGNSTI